MIKINSMIIILLFVSGCAFFNKKEKTFALSEITTYQKNSEIGKLQIIQNRLIEEKTGEADVLLGSFKAEFPNTENQDAVDFLEAWILEKRQSWTEASVIYRQFLGVRGVSEEVIALALFHLGNCYLNLEEYEKALAAYLDSQERARFLPKETRYIELPLRIMMSYQKTGDDKSVYEWLKKTYDGANYLQSQNLENKKDFLPKIYFMLGNIEVNNPNELNFEKDIDLAQMTNRFLFDSLKYNHPVWSQKAYEKLVAQFNLFWQKIKSQRAPESSNMLLAQKVRRDKQVQMTTQLLPLIYFAKSFEPYAITNVISPEVVFFDYLEELEKEISEFLINDLELTPLTKEALELNSLKKVGQSININLSTPEPIDNSSQDPNL